MLNHLKLRFYFFIASVCIPLSFLSGCSSTGVKVPVILPGNIDLTRYDSLIVGNFTENVGQDFSDELAERLVKSGYLKVMRPGNNTPSNIIAAIQGRAREEIKKDQTYEKASKLYIRKIAVTISGSVEVIDKTNGQILYKQSFNETCPSQDSRMDNWPPDIDPNPLRRTCMKRSVQIVHDAISPHIVFRTVPFEECEDMPKLKKGIKLASLGNLGKASQIFSSAISEVKDKPNINPECLKVANWNLGLAHTYNGKFAEAEDIFQKLYLESEQNLTTDMLNTPNKYKAEIENVRKLREEYNKLRNTLKPSRTDKDL